MRDSIIFLYSRFTDQSGWICETCFSLSVIHSLSLSPYLSLSLSPSVIPQDVLTSFLASFHRHACIISSSRAIGNRNRILKSSGSNELAGSLNLHISGVHRFVKLATTSIVFSRVAWFIKNFYCFSGLLSSKDVERERETERERERERDRTDSIFESNNNSRERFHDIAAKTVSVASVVLIPLIDKK